MVNSSLPMALYHQVAGVLRQRIEDGEYPLGFRIASEDELSVEFAVSRATIRQAVGALVAEGKLTRKQGSGTYVSAPHGGRLRQRFRGSLSDLIRESHDAAPRNVEILHDQSVTPAVQRALELATPVATIVRRTRMMGGEPFSYTVTHLPPRIGHGLNRAKLMSRALMEVLIDEGTAVATATQSVRAQLADAALSGRIDVDFGAAVLYVERVVRDVAGAPVEYVQSWYRGDRYEYTVSLDLGADERARLA